jgi:predicted nucleic acid-binding protein
LFTFANRYTAFVDACVLAKSLPRNLMLNLAEAEFFLVRWSHPVMDETHRAIERMQAKQPDAAKRAASACAAMERAFDDAIVEGFDSFLPVCAVLPDQNDAHVLAAAIKTRADVLVTDNLKHFPEDVLATFNIEARSADAFIADTVALDEGLAVAVIGRMRQDCRQPPLTADKLLRTMEARGLLKTADVLKPYVGSL